MDNKMENKMDKTTIWLFSYLCVIVAFMDISGLPGGFFTIQKADIRTYVLPLIVNFIIIGLFCFIFFKLYKTDYRFGFTKKGLGSGIKKYALPGVIVAVLSLIAFWVGLSPFDYQPTIWKILVEGILYYIGVAIVEEFYVRGLLLNIIEAIFHKKKNSTTIAIIASSLIFGLGHIPGMIGNGVGVIIFKLISTIALGFYLGMIYKKTNNLWLPIFMHALIDIAALPYCFTKHMRYEKITLIILIITYIVFTAYCLLTILKKSKTIEAEKNEVVDESSDDNEQYTIEENK